VPAHTSPKTMGRCKVRQHSWRNVASRWVGEDSAVGKIKARGCALINNPRPVNMAQPSIAAKHAAMHKGCA
jgi:hypothetical protein